VNFQETSGHELVRQSRHSSPPVGTLRVHRRQHSLPGRQPGRQAPRARGSEGSMGPLALFGLGPPRPCGHPRSSSAEGVTDGVQPRGAVRRVRLALLPRAGAGPRPQGERRRVRAASKASAARWLTGAAKA